MAAMKMPPLPQSGGWRTALLKAGVLPALTLAVALYSSDQGLQLPREAVRVKCLILIAMVLGASGLAAAQDAATVPAKQTVGPPQTPLRLLPARLPQQRHARASVPTVIPEQFSPPQEAYAAFPERDTAVASAEKPTDCDVRLGNVASFEPLRRLVGPGECGAVDAVRLNAVILPDQARVVVTPPAILRCPMAEAVAGWLREDVAPAALKLGSPLRGLDNFDSYECRGRNRVRGATLSEHGRANALDVRGLKLANGEEILLTDVNVAKNWREALRASACARFSTVLGPGSDGNHEVHIHLDLAERRGDYKTCEWQVREPAKQADQPAAAVGTDTVDTAAQPDETVPLPRPRPIANAADIQPRRMRSQLR
jgi:hypothetical protein